MTPSELYLKQIANGIISEHPAQREVIQIFDVIHQQLLLQEKQQHSLLYNLRQMLHQQKPVSGLYLWGDVGSGKTMLMNLFYQTIAVKKTRIHFHEFMQRVHHSLKTLQGKKNPLTLLAKNISNETTVLCLDEFMVTDIADAMILSELLQQLFQQGVCLITSSNTFPDNLYKNGLQRERFLPAIELIKKYMIVFNLFVNQDYRLRHIQQAGVYYSPLNAQAEKNLQECFNYFSQNAPSTNEPIQILGRTVRIIKQAKNVIWFDFKDLCGIPRSQLDYLELVKNYHTFLISNIPKIAAHEDHTITSFINLIDVLYDAHAKVIISAELYITDIYISGKKSAEFARTKSRIIEMQSQNYVYPGFSGPELTTI